jgi:small subunit ribosomal protein S16
VAVKIKLKRLGRIREPYYRIVVADARTKRDGRAIEEIGKYHPKSEPSLIEVNSERVQHWLSVGAQPTDPVRALLKVTGDWQKFTGEPGAEGTLRIAAPRADKKEAFAVAAKASQASQASKASQASQAGKEAGDKASGPGKAGSRPAQDGPGQGGRAKSGSGGSAQGGRAKAAPARAEAPAAEAAPAEAQADSTAAQAPADAGTEA